MKFGISTCSIDRQEKPIIQNLNIFKNAGFNLLEMDAHDYSSFPYKSGEFIGNLKNRLKELEISIHSIHAPFHNSISTPHIKERKSGVDDIIELMECTLPLAEEKPGKIFLVIHPGEHLTKTKAEDQFGYCLESLSKILESPNANYYHICIENMLSSHFGGKSLELLALINTLKGKRISVCLDTSHCVYDSNPERFLEEVFDNLATTHISGNYHQSHGEFHAIPMTLKHTQVNWEHFFKRLSQRLDTIIFELNKPYFLDNDIYLKMVNACIEQVERYISYS